MKKTNRSLDVSLSPSDHKFAKNIVKQIFDEKLIVFHSLSDAKVFP